MSWRNPASIKKEYWTRRLCLILLVFIGTTWLTQDVWRPHYYNWHCSRIAAELSKQYGLVVRYGDPAEFYISPEKPLISEPEKGFLIERVKTHYALTALKGVQSALTKYPPELIKNHLHAVFIAGLIKTFGTEIGASYHKTWIYLSALEKYEPGGSNLYELNLHHELSSLFLNRASFPSTSWKSVNSEEFKYLSKSVDVVKAAAVESRQDPQNAHMWYQDGFVHDYGMSSLNNDFNMYAELAMADPEKLAELAQQYPRIKAKTQIFVEFYSSLATELGAYFKSVGLAD